MKIKLRCIFNFWFLVFSFSSSMSSAYAMGERPTREPRYVRVAVIRSTPSLSLTLRGPYKIRTLHTDEPIFVGKGLRGAKVSPTPSGIKINESTFKIYRLNIETERAGGIYLNRRRFRGSIDIIREADQTLLVVNEIDVEDYLYGVLRGEVPHRWPLEALKAQAVAARTFALYQNSINVDRDYDLTSDIYSQVYGGKSIERFWTNRAVNRTRGQVLIYNGKLFPTYYHATCGGHTEDASKLWDIELTPLKGVKDPFCRKSPHFQWRSVVNLREVRTKLASHGYKVGRILSIIPKGRDRAGRIEQVEILHNDGRLEILAHRFRRIVGIGLIRSTNFTSKIEGSIIKFYGLGWGHGVGLCQWGTHFMARKGYKYDQILRHYYPDAEIVNLNEHTTYGTK